MAGPKSARPSAPGPHRRGTLALITVLGLMVCGGVAAQQLQFPTRPAPPPKSNIAIEREKSGQKQMLVQASEIDYDYVNHRVAAVGNVQIYYGGSVLEADRVIYDQTTKRLHAEGNVRLTDADKHVTYGDIMDLSDDYRDGFVDSLRLDSPEQTRMAAARAERTSGNFNIFYSGVYTACAPCKDDPRKPPLWQVKAARIIHDQGEKMLYFEDAHLEFFGQSLLWLPYFSAPDPTVKRKTGFLIPSFSSSSQVYGLATEIPYYWALAPDYDLTLAPMITSRQGVLMDSEFRQRLINGAYTIRAAGIYQLDKNAFEPAPGTAAPGFRDWRGSIESAGQFALSEKWLWGWDALAMSDKTFLNDYNPQLSRFHTTDNPLQIYSESVSQLYLTGRGNRSYFDVRGIYFAGLSTADTQAQIPVIHPVLDYNYTVDHSVFGGEFGYDVNVTSLTRTQAEFDAINQTASMNNTCVTTNPSVKTPTNCLLAGFPGTYSRFTTEAHWKATYTDSLGQQFTPFASLRADAGVMQINNDPSVANYINTGDTELVRAMPTVGLEYRFPFISRESWGTQTVEPIAQVIARPNEPQIGKWPTEDAQSLMFDDSNLFRVDKYSGYDRVEGGGRANYGVEYTAQFNRGGALNALFGESYSLFGQNSFANGGTTNTGLDSGLDTTRSDYVARVAYKPNNTYTFTSRFRFDSDTFAAQRTEIEAAARFDRWNVSALYGDYAAQPEIGFLNRRQGVLGTASVKLDANWVFQAGARYGLNSGGFDQTNLGLGYVDDCIIFAVNYVTNYSYSTGAPVLNHSIMLQINLRTLGGTTTSQSLSTGVH